VWFTPEEGSALAAELGLAEPEFYRRYARKVDNRWSLREHKTTHGYDCVFLDRETIPGKAVCSVYSSRPTQCRTWPFWPEMLKSRSAWDGFKRRTPCPGMDQGRLVSVEQIRIQRDSSPR
jgi:Fe-S-cluster containining protein